MCGILIFATPFQISYQGPQTVLIAKKKKAHCFTSHFCSELISIASRAVDRMKTDH